MIILYMIFLLPLTIDAYHLAEYGQFCSNSNTRITSRAACQAAADNLGLDWGNGWWGPWDFPGCLHTRDPRDKVYFNYSPFASKVPNNPNYAEICTGEGGEKQYKQEIDEVMNKYLKHHDDSIIKLKETGDIQGFFYPYNKCGFLKGATCVEEIVWAVYQCWNSPDVLQCIESEVLNCLECISNICQHITDACENLPCIPCCDFVQKKETDGSNCNRDCTIKNDFKICVFNFTATSQMSDTSGRLADGRVRKVLTYNDRIPGPSIVVCELDTVVINLKNEIDGTLEERHGQSSGTTLHMHGIRQWGQPYEDGVPGVTQCEIPSGKSFQYIMNANDDHENAPPGTYWYHSHVGKQRTNGLYGPLIIKPRCKPFYDIDGCNNDIDDDAYYTLVLQEWYKTETDNRPVSILINGIGRVCVPNPHHPSYVTNYTEFDVDKGKCYRFRLIGAISQNFPLCISIEDHKFTAIATDSIDFKQEPHVEAVCLAAGERYDIVVKTNADMSSHPDPYMIKVYGQSDNGSPLCTLAWLKYPGQKTVSKKNYCIDQATCSHFKPIPGQKVLNPIMTPSYGKDSNDVTLDTLKPITPPNTIDWSINKNYVQFSGVKFNDFSMTYNKVPFLFQSPADTTLRCGPTCNQHILDISNPPCTVPSPPLPHACPSGPPCQCEHVVHQPHVPGYAGEFFWFETILINPSDVAHPIHQHGGWFRVVAIGPVDVLTWGQVDVAVIKRLEGNGVIKRNLINPIQKDTIQVPANGYVIFRTPLDNAGTWIVHCHINHHVESGMAMVFQIGGLGEIYPGQDWHLGPFASQVNALSCPINTYQNPASINWFFGMKPIQACCDPVPGNSITFTWLTGHNVVELDSQAEYDGCTGFTSPGDTTPTTGDFIWPCPTIPGDYYLACGVGNGYHCQHGGLKAQVTVPCP